MAELNVSKNRSFIVGAYFNDKGIVNNPKIGSKNSVTTNKLNNYMAVLEAVNLHNVNVRLVNSELYDESIVFNENADDRHSRSGVKFSKSDLNSLKNISRTETVKASIYDLLVNDIVVVLNLSDRTVFLKDKTGAIHVKEPIVINKLDSFKGKVLFLSIKAYSHIKTVYRQTGIENYIKFELEKDVKTESSKTEDFKFLDNIIDNHELDEGDNDKHSTYKVVRMTEFDITDFQHRDKTGNIIKSYYVKEHDVIISVDNYINIPQHPSEHKEYHFSQQELSVIERGDFACYIVDRENLIGDRYFNFVGNVFKVPKVTDSKNDNGLYYVYRDEKNELVVNHHSLSEIDNQFFIYKSREEAVKGLNIAELTREEFSRDKLEIERELIRIKMESEISKNEYQTKIKELEMAIKEAEAKSKSEELLFKSKLMEKEAEIENLKIKAQERSFRHEEVRQGYKESNDKIALYVAGIGLVAVLVKLFL